ncbi:hypothetical protein Lesp02_45990 [Lentzea sp. NBRC 105346]|uniref:hypothetical protein n=1 Tax=Lentzea sp. NBRC 105346 TaxID=3032205 RepID=UPI00249FEE19|nr:hypothetical protein [Lentzea sp. NBRC 105346]GLZ32411.1 hypothetical protein Lesp02_45990 [Lentzea sp. NBRC 105346]
MADTCYLCAAQDGIATCAVCTATACAHHGELVPFRCVDCITAGAARRALSAGPEPRSFADEAPRLAAAGRSLMDHRFVDDLHHALKQFTTDPEAVWLQVRERLGSDVLVERVSGEMRTIEPPSDPSRNRAEYAAAVLAAAVAARRGWSLERSILQLPGGPQMPVPVLLLDTMLMVRLASSLGF